MSVTTTFEEAAGAMVGRMFESAVGAWELICAYVGRRLGLYQALVDSPAGLTSAGLADASGIDRRYAQEWLEQQTVAGYLDVDDPKAPPETRVFALPPAHAAVLTGEETPFFAGPLADWTAAIPPVLPKLFQAYRTGGGVEWSDFGEVVLDGQAAFNRPLFETFLADHLAQHAPDIDARLKEEGGSIADVACGYGWSSVALAAAYPKTTVRGFDVDPSSVERARGIVADAGVADRVRIELVDASRADLAGPYRLATIFEALHDLPRPVETLRRMRDALAPGGAVIVMDENVTDDFGDGIGNPVERFMYTASVLCCLPCGLAEEPSAATGTVMRPSTLRRYAEDAGFSKVTELPIEDGFHRWYRLDG